MQGRLFAPANRPLILLPPTIEVAEDVTRRLGTLDLPRGLDDPGEHVHARNRSFTRKDHSITGGSL